MDKAKPIWPEVFRTGIITDKQSNHELCADGLYAWAICCTGSVTIPDNFGKVMSKISQRLDIDGDPDSFHQWAKDHEIS